MVYYFYAGCYTSSPQGEGIHLLRLDSESGGLRVENSFYGGENPSFLIRSGNCLYAANEIGSAGKASALSVGAGNALTFLNSRQAQGAGTCHIAEMNGYLYGANYESGSIFGAEILEDGSLGSVVTEIRHTGSGPNAGRQKGPHAHSVNPVPDTGFLIAADLGADKLFCYDQQKDGSLMLNSIHPAVAAPAGCGPRHLAFRGKRAYTVMEMGVNLVVYKMTEKGFEQEDVYPLLEGDFTLADTAADIHFTGDGTRLYASVRGKNILSAFTVNEGGALAFIGSYPAHGNSPRNFCFSPDEKFVLLANQFSGTVTVCPLDPGTGSVGNMLSSAALPGVSCIINV